MLLAETRRNGCIKVKEVRDQTSDDTEDVQDQEDASVETLSEDVPSEYARLT